MRVFACSVVSKLQRHQCPTFGALRFRTNRGQTDSYIFIYIRVDYVCFTIHISHVDLFRIRTARRSLQF
jgi:hypothetical protein